MEEDSEAFMEYMVEDSEAWGTEVVPVEDREASLAQGTEAAEQN